MVMGANQLKSGVPEVIRSGQIGQGLARSVTKHSFTSAPILHHFDPSLLLIIKTDVSNYTIVGILSAQTDSNKVHLVAFCS